MTDNERLDLDVFAVIDRDGPCSFSLVLNRTGTRPEYERKVDRSLQRLRKAGRIKHHRGLWEVAK